MHEAVVTTDRIGTIADGEPLGQVDQEVQERPVTVGKKHQRLTMIESEPFCALWRQRKMTDGIEQEVELEGRKTKDGNVLN